MDQKISEQRWNGSQRARTALHTICDSLLEREQGAIEDRDIEAIEALHERMPIKDACGEAIRQHREKSQKAL